MIKNSNSKLFKKYLISLFIFSFSPFIAISQTSNVIMDKLLEQLQSLSQNSQAELVYLQTNKDIYETGEDLWFKAYLLDNHNFTPSGLSQTLYLQVINEKTGLAVWNEKYEIQNGFADGHVFLQDNLIEGNYLLAAYTGSSFYNDSTGFNAFYKIKVKKNMNPRITVKNEFNRLFYNVNDTIRLKLTVLSEHGDPAYMAEIEAGIRQGNKKSDQSKATTDQKGETTLFFIPKTTGEGLNVDIKVKYALKEEYLNIPVPCIKKSPIQFNVFPEGGNLVSGLASSLAFKAVDVNGRPLDIEGTLFEDDKQLLDFKSNHDGMGIMKLIPVSGKKYLIRLTKPQIDSTFALPDIHNEGIVMHLERRDEKYLEFIVSKSTGIENMTVYLRGQLRGVVYCIASGFLIQDLNIRIPINEFPSQGIAEFTLFNEKLIPLAERLVYINPDKKLYIETTLSKERYETREKASLKISVKNENGDPVIANLGVSVYDKLYQNPQTSQNILTNCYLSSQLRGKIYDPAYYFDIKNEGRSDALDLLLLTQGWRNYVWNEENLKVTSIQKQIIFDGTQGKAYAKKQKKGPGEQKFVMAFNPEKKEYKDLIMTDSSGQFTITPQHLRSGMGGYVYIKPMGLTEDGLQIRLSDPFQSIDEIRKKKEVNEPLQRLPAIKKEEDLSSFLVAGHNAIKLPQVTIKGSGIQTFRDKYIGHLDSLAKLDFKKNDYVCVSGILNCPIHEKASTNKKPVEGVTYELYIGFKWLNDNKAYTFSGFLNEKYQYPKFSEEMLLKMNNLTRVKGYYPHKEFYQPNYNKESDENLLADYRNTLLWAPSVTTNQKGEAILDFFCSDINYGFVGKIEGVSGDGLLGSKEFDFIVRKARNSK